MQGTKRYGQSCRAGFYRIMDANGGKRSRLGRVCLVKNSRLFGKIALGEDPRVVKRFHRDCMFQHMNGASVMAIDPFDPKSRGNRSRDRRAHVGTEKLTFCKYHQT